MKDTDYYFHQTPNDLAKTLINTLPLCDGDIVLEPFKGEGAFYNNFPDYVDKRWCELEDGRDYKDFIDEIDWVITNPPFKLINTTGKRENSFYSILKFYLTKARKGIAFLGNDYCLSSLTPKRLKELNQLGWYINKISVCSIKRWRGRYFFIVFTKEPSQFYNLIDGVF